MALIARHFGQTIKRQAKNRQRNAHTHTHTHRNNSLACTVAIFAFVIDGNRRRRRQRIVDRFKIDRRRRVALRARMCAHTLRSCTINRTPKHTHVHATSARASSFSDPNKDNSPRRRATREYVPLIKSTAQPPSERATQRPSAHPTTSGCA